MNSVSPAMYPTLVSNKRLTRENTLVRKQTNIGANKIILTLPEECFFEDDCVRGTLFLDIKNKINAKRITLQFIGEMNYVIPESPQSDGLTSGTTLHELMDQFQILPTLNKTPTFKRSVTQGNRLKSMPTLNERNTPQTPTSTNDTGSYTTRNLIRRSSSNPNRVSRKVTKSLSLLHSVSRVYPIIKPLSQPNTEIFCHYRVPLFTFTDKCLPGRYRLPFSFEFNDLTLPTTNFSRENLQLFIKYYVIAEIEEEMNDLSCDEESDDDDDRPRRLLFTKPENMKCKSVIEILWNYAVHIRESSLYTRNEIVKTKELLVTRYFCSCFSYVSAIELKMPKNIITFGDVVPFSVQITNLQNNPSISLTINLIEEVTNSAANVNETNVIQLEVKMNESKTKNSIAIDGQIDFGERVNGHSLISNEWNITHTIEFKFKVKNLFDSKTEKMLMPCLIVPNLTPKQIRRITGEKVEPVDIFQEENIDDDILQLPYCKFKLDKRFDVANEVNSNKDDVE